MHSVTRILLLALLQARLVQSPPEPRVAQTPTEQCSPVARVFNASEVSQPAAFASRTTDGPRPVRDAVGARRRGADSVIVEFTVDTTGAVVPMTFRVLQSPSRDLATRVREAHGAWRFRSARVGGCKVPQVVQTAVEWVTVSAPGRAPP